MNVLIDKCAPAEVDTTNLPDPKRAALLSLLPGLGQLYIGEKFRGSLFLAVSLVNLTLFVAMAFPLLLAGALGQIGGVFHLELNPDLMRPLLRGHGAGFVIFVWFMLYASYVLFSVRSAYDHAVRIHKGRKYAPMALGLPEAVSGSYLFHYAFMACCLLVLLFVVAPKPPVEQATDIELVEPPPPEPAAKPKAAPPKVEPPKTIEPPKPEPPKPVPPPKVTPVAVAVPTDAPSPDAVALAPSAPSTPPTTTSGSGDPGASSGSGDSSDIDYGAYLANMQRKIKKAWFPPRGNESKTVTLKFKIHKNGEVTDIRLAKGSGISQVDDAATQAVQSAAPFGPLPAGSPDVIDIKFTFDYNVFNAGGGGFGSRFRQF